MIGGGSNTGAGAEVTTGGSAGCTSYRAHRWRRPVGEVGRGSAAARSRGARAGMPGTYKAGTRSHPALTASVASTANPPRPGDPAEGRPSGTFWGRTPGPGVGLQVDEGRRRSHSGSAERSLGRRRQGFERQRLAVSSEGGAWPSLGVHAGQVTGVVRASRGAAPGITRCTCHRAATGSTWLARLRYHSERGVGGGSAAPWPASARVSRA